MGILQKLKSLLGADGTQSPTTTEPTVTVEREPSVESEHAVKGTDTPGVDEPATPDAAGGIEDAASVEDIDGIGPTYADRLAEAGIESVADLAESDVETVAGAAEASASRVQDWLEQARSR